MLESGLNMTPSFASQNGYPQLPTPRHNQTNGVTGPSKQARPPNLHNGQPILQSRPDSRTSPTMTTHSAPVSPLSRPKPPVGLAPLSQISAVDISSSRGTAAQSNGHAHPSYYRRKVSQPIQGLSTGTAGPGPSSMNFRQASAQEQQTLSQYSLGKAITDSARGVPSALRSRGRSRRSNRGASSSSETETEVDSDSTFVPGRRTSTGIRHKHSYSQPDLGALRSRLEGWAGNVAKEREKSAGSMKKRATPPSPGMGLPHFGSSAHAKSHSSLVAMRKSPSPRTSPSLLTPLTPVLSSTSSEGSSPFTVGRSMPVGGMTGSEDGDDDYDGTSGTGTDSESLSFSPKRTGMKYRPPERTKSGLGLSLEPSPTIETKEIPKVKPEDIPVILRRSFQQSTLLALRLLAVVPSVWGICVLLDALRTGGLWVDVWPWGVDLSKEALERLVAGGVSEDGVFWRVHRGDMILCIAWAMCTAHFCFALTTGLTHRWRSYYPLISTLTRLLSLQCLCWPATYITLWFLGAKRPLLAWVVIGVTTGWSRTVQMWVTSNVIPGTGGEATPRAKRSPPLPPSNIGWLERFTWGRVWDWDAVAREVGWKVGGLLLITAAWLFWGFESGRFIEVQSWGHAGVGVV